MIRRRPILLPIVAILMAAVPTCAAEEPDPAHAPPELKVLQRMVGHWHETVELDDRTIEGEGTVQWVLGGTHLESKYVIDLLGGEKLHFLSLTTWNAEDEIYRTWLFRSFGEAPETYTGIWDEKSQTLTQTSELNADGVVFTLRTTFVCDDRLEWTVEARDASGQFLFANKGNDVRKKPDRDGR